jgi:O-acetyl-ADP-ribose deacetylase (regulator of RNase III)
MIEHLIGDVTLPEGTDRRILAHVCNDVGAYGRGVAGDVAARYPRAEREYRTWYAGRLRQPIPMRLGMVQFVQVEEGLWVANMVAQQGLRSRHNPKPLVPEALRECLAKVAARALSLDASLHMPRIGTGLAGGTWEEVEPLILEEVFQRGVRVLIYTPPRHRDVPGRSKAPPRAPNR